VKDKYYKIVPVPPDHFLWLYQRTKVVLTADFTAIAAIDEDRMEVCDICHFKHPVIFGMIGFSDWTKNAASMHYAMDKPIAARGLMFAAFDYLFRQAGRKIAIGVTRASNTRSLKINAKLGFKPVYVIKDGYDDGQDVVIQRLDRADWEAKYGD
jgi:RimJ/RimL family protein N-acetyltransferase